MAISVSDKSLLRKIEKAVAVAAPDKQETLLGVLVDSQKKTDEVLLFIGKQLMDLKAPRKPVDVIATVIRDKNDRITQIHIKENRT